MELLSMVSLSPRQRPAWNSKKKTNDYPMGRTNIKREHKGGENPGMSLWLKSVPPCPGPRPLPWPLPSSALSCPNASPSLCFSTLLTLCLFSIHWVRLHCHHLKGHTKTHDLHLPQFLSDVLAHRYSLRRFLDWLASNKPPRCQPKRKRR